MCDIAILIVDLMHGLEPQTKESIKLLRERNCPFVVALNKVDRLYEWKSHPEKDIEASLKTQKPNTQQEWKERLSAAIADFSQEGINVAPYWENRDANEYVPMVPTSAFLGDGVGNIMAYLAMYAQQHLRERLTYVESLQCTVLEVKSLPGLGTTIDVILVRFYTRPTLYMHSLL